jgi:hypothetical protein
MCLKSILWRNVRCMKLLGNWRGGECLSMGRKLASLTGLPSDRRRGTAGLADISRGTRSFSHSSIRWRRSYSVSVLQHFSPHGKFLGRGDWRESLPFDDSLDVPYCVCVDYPGAGYLFLEAESVGRCVEAVVGRGSE